MPTPDPAPPPSGFVTFVFTDIEDSMKICHALGNDVFARDVVEPHHQRVRDLIARYGGHENRTFGDSFMIAFDRADDALACAAAIQAALADPPIVRRDNEGHEWTVRVRIGVHTATAQFSRDALYDYAGHDANFAARVQSLGRGGQVIVSHAAVRAAGTASRYAWAHWPNRRLKSISEPETVHEMLWRGPGTSAGEPGSRWVPAWFKGEQNRYIPREALENEVLAAFADADSSGSQPRLVTLHATGGMGKTRLAIACAIKAVGFFDGDVLFIPLDDAPQPDPGWFVERLARTLGLTGAAATEENVARNLEDRLCLLVLDNFESVDCDAVAGFIGRLLRGTTRLRLLVTGRKAVRLDDVERPIRLDDGLSPEEARDLFVERAAWKKPPRWKPAAEELALVDQIVAELERIPLAIELAAAWVGRRTFAEIHAHLRKALLGPITDGPPGSRRADPAPRHRSMRACLEYSWALLEPQYHDGFASLSLFADSFDAESVAAACGAGDAEGLLQGLTDAALLKWGEQAGASRYAMLRAVHGFAGEKFDALPDRARRVRAFVECCARVVSANDNLKDDAQRATLGREWRNAAGAAALAEEAELWSEAASISASLAAFLRMRGELAACELLLGREVRAAAGLGDAGIESRASNSLGNVLMTRGDPDGAEAMYRKALEINEGLGRPEGMAIQYGNLGNVLMTRGDPDGAEAMYRKALEINEGLGRPEGMAIQYGNLGNVLQARGDFDGAEAMYRKALEINEGLGRPEGMAIQYGNLGNVLMTRGDFDGAEAMHRKALAIDERLGRPEGMAIQYGNLGNVLQARGDFDGAEAMHRKALEIEERLGRPEGMASDYGNLGNVLQARGDFDGAEAMHRKALAIDERLGRPEGMASDYGNLGTVLQARGDLDEARESWTKSRDLFAKLGAKHMADRVQGWIDQLPG